MRKLAPAAICLVVLGLAARPVAAQQPAPAPPATQQPAAAAPEHAAPTAPAPATTPAPGEHAATQPAPTPPAATEPAAAQPAPASGHEPAAGHAPAAGEGHEAAESHGESIWAFLGRIFNFAVLVGLLFWALRGPVGQHLATRRQQIASDLVTARETTARAQHQITDIDRRLKELPAELEALKSRGAEEVAAEGARIRQQAEAERHRLLDQTRRDVELLVRLAKQSLTEHTADLAVKLAHERLAATITPADQDRLVDRYVSHVKELHG